MSLKRKVLTTAVASVLGLAVAGAAHSAAVTGLVVQDTDGDGRAGRFGFNALLTSDWTGDVGTGTILGQLRQMPPVPSQPAFSSLARRSSRTPMAPT